MRDMDQALQYQLSHDVYILYVVKLIILYVVRSIYILYKLKYIHTQYIHTSTHNIEI